MIDAGHDTLTTSYPLWTLDKETVARLADEGGMLAPKGKPGSVLLFHSNIVHASAPNISPWGPGDCLSEPVPRGQSHHPVQTRGMDRPSRFCTD